MQTPCFLLGVGGHAKVLADELPPLWQLKAVLAYPTSFLANCDYFKTLGVDCLEESLETLSLLKTQGIHHAFVAIGDNLRRQKMTHQLQAQGFLVPNLISEHAYIAQTAQLGAYGIQILAGTHIGANACVAEGCLVNHHAIVEHDASLGAFSHLAPNAVMLGGVKVGGLCLVGANTTILPSVEVTDGCTIGAGATVCHSITQAGIYKGVI